MGEREGDKPYTYGAGQVQILASPTRGCQFQSLFLVEVPLVEVDVPYRRVCLNGAGGEREIESSHLRDVQPVEVGVPYRRVRLNGARERESSCCWSESVPCTVTATDKK